MSVLVLAGTSEAAALVDRLVRHEIDVVASLAGRTSAPRALPCPVRVGGFGGVEGLVAELRNLEVHALVDATHPFADVMPWRARDAAAQLSVPHLRFVRPPWPPRASWTEVDDLVAAADALRQSGARRALLTVGRQELDAFRGIDADLVVRSIDEPPDGPWAVVLGRGPFSYGDELTLLGERGIDTIITRNSGGPTAKLDAADTAGVRVVVIRRPPQVDAPTVADVDAAVEWVLGCR